MEQANSKVQEAISKLINDVDKACLRKMQVSVQRFQCMSPWFLRIPAGKHVSLQTSTSTTVFAAKTGVSDHFLFIIITPPANELPHCAPKQRSYFLPLLCISSLIDKWIKIKTFVLQRRCVLDDPSQMYIPHVTP